MKKTRYLSLIFSIIMILSFPSINPGIIAAENALTISDVTVSDAIDYMVTMNVTNNTGSRQGYNIIFSAYEDGKLVDFQITLKTICANGSESISTIYTKPISVSNDAVIKFSVWNSLSSLSPCMNFITVSGTGSGGNGGVSYDGSASGKIVGVAYQPATGNRQIYFIDDNIRIYGEPITTLGKNQIVVKTDRPVDEQDYILFETCGTNYSNLLGYQVDIQYNYDASGPVYTIQTIKTTEYTEVQVMEAKSIDRQKTNTENELYPTKKVIMYYDNNGVLQSKKLPADLTTLTMIYNNKLIKKNDEGVSAITIDDLMPIDGKVTYIDITGDDMIDLIRVEAFDTYVVDKVNMTPKSIEDKFRKDTNGNAVKLLIDESSVNIDVEIVDKNGDALTFDSIVRNNTLSVARSKCGTYLKIVVINQVLNSVIVNETDTGILKLSGTTYEKSWYYTTFVEGSVEFEINDRITGYLDQYGRISWIGISPTNYTIGYIMEAKYVSSGENSSLIMNIATAGINGSAISKSYTITNASSLKVDGDKTRSLEGIYNYLVEKAAAINEGKPDVMTSTALTSLPVRYIESGTSLFAIETLALDTNYKYTDTSRQYHTSAYGSYFSKGDDNLNIITGATLMFVPNHRTGYGVGGYMIGASSTLSSKLIEYANYNVEAYFILNTNGVPEHKLLVIYNESIDAQPTFRSENIIVGDIKSFESGGSVITQITPYTGTGSATNYTLSVNTGVNAFVLDAHYNRMRDAGGAYIKRAISKGDVIRFGYLPDKKIVNLELVFDISEKLAERRFTAVMRDGTKVGMSGIDSAKSSLTYYGRVGLITSTAEEQCTMTFPDPANEYLPVDQKLPDVSDGLWLGMSYQNRTAYLYDFTSTAANPISLITMPQVSTNDMIFVQMSTNLAIKYIYVVRYPYEVN